MFTSFVKMFLFTWLLLALPHLLLSTFFVFSQDTQEGGDANNNILEQTLKNVGSLASRVSEVGISESRTEEPDSLGGVTDAVESLMNTVNGEDGAGRETPIANVLANKPLMNVLKGSRGNSLGTMFGTMTPEGAAQILNVVNGNALLLQMTKVLAGADSDPAVPLDFNQLVDGLTRLASQFTGASSIDSGMLEELSKFMPADASTSFELGAISGMMNEDGTVNADFLEFLEDFGTQTATEAVGVKEFGPMNVKPASLEKVPAENADTNAAEAAEGIESVVNDAAVSVVEAIEEVSSNPAAASRAALQSLENALNDFLLSISSLRSSRNVMDADRIKNYLNLLQSRNDGALREGAEPVFLEALAQLSAFEGLEAEDGENSIVAELGELLSLEGDLSDLVREEGHGNKEALAKLLQRITRSSETTSELPDSGSANILAHIQKNFGSLLEEVAGDSYGVEEFSLDWFFNADGTVNSEVVRKVASDILSFFEADSNPTPYISIEDIVSQISSFAKENAGVANGEQAPEANSIVETVASLSADSIAPRGVIDIAGSLLGDGGLLAGVDLSTFVTENGAISVDGISSALAETDLGNVEKFLEGIGIDASESISVGKAVKLLTDSIAIDKNGNVTVNKKPLGTLAEAEDTVVLTPADQSEALDDIVGASAAPIESALSNLVNRSDGALNVNGSGAAAAAITQTVHKALGDSSSKNLVGSVGNAIRTSNPTNRGNVLGNAGSMRGALGNAVGNLVKNRGGENSPMRNVAQAMSGVMTGTNEPLQGVAGNFLGNRSTMRSVAKTVTDVVANGPIQGVSGSVLGTDGAGHLVDSIPLGADGPLSAIGTVAENLGVDNTSELLDLANILNVTRNSTVDDVLQSLNAANGTVTKRVQKATGFQSPDNAVLRANGQLIDRGKLAAAFLSSFNRSLLGARGTSLHVAQ